MKNIPEFSVSEITELTRSILEEKFDRVRIKGEISKVKENKGHLYFSLKDEKYILNAICWSSNVNNLKILPEEGMEVFAEGKITTYAKGSISSYQINVDQIDLQGEGTLLKIIEERRKKLQKEGYFDISSKKNIKTFPDKIGIITSPSGAVIMDIINRIRERFPIKLLIYPVSVQGIKTAQEVIQGLNFFNTKIFVDTIIIARGGGGLEDLMPFNDEQLIKQVFKSKIPVISAIGHETDNTLLDFVADYRASTPTAAAEKAVPDQKAVFDKIFFFNKQLKSNFNLLFLDKKKILNQYSKSLDLKTLKNFIKDKNKYLANLNSNLFLNIKNNFKFCKLELKNKLSRLESLNLKNILKRGFTIIKDKNNKIVTRSVPLKKSSDISITFFDGELKGQIK